MPSHKLFSWESCFSLSFTVSFVLVNGGATSAPIADDYNAAVERIRSSTPTPPAERTSAFRFGFDAYRTEAAILAKVHGPDIIKFLRARHASRPIGYDGLALTTLALLASDPDAAAEFTALFNQRGYRDVNLLMALTYAPASAALALADNAFKLRYTQPGALRLASTLYRFFGDANRASALEMAIPRTPLPKPDARPEAADLIALRQRLSQPPGEQAAWLNQDLLIWRACRFTTRDRGRHRERQLQVDGVCALARFSPTFLKARIAASVIELDEIHLIFLVAASQPDPAFVPDLASHITSRTPYWGQAVAPLLAIHTRDALAAVESLISPPIVVPKSSDPFRDESERLEHQSFVQNLCLQLALCGDLTTLSILESHSTNTAYPANERKFFVEACVTLRRRLGPPAVTKSQAQ